MPTSPDDPGGFRVHRTRPLCALANHSQLSPLRFLERSASVFPDRTAIIYGDRRYTYAEFAEETQRLARS